MQRGTFFKSHWENIYSTKNEEACSWFQAYPRTSIELIESFNLPKTIRIVDIGGGDSRLVDVLLQLGYTDITVLDISAAAIEKARNRLGEQAAAVRWIVCDVNEFAPAAGEYDLWHDRAAFHFLTEEQQIDHYAEVAARAIRSGAHFILGTFSPDGPEKCSGLEICRYSQSAMKACFSSYFRCLGCRPMCM